MYGKNTHQVRERSKPDILYQEYVLKNHKKNVRKKGGIALTPAFVSLVIVSA